MSNLVERIAESMSSLGVRRAYGEPVTIGGAELIPVALVYFGFGGGKGESEGSEGGDDKQPAGSGEGGGGGGASIPIGAYVTGFDGPTFKPNPIALLIVSIPVLWVGGHSFARVIRALKK
ncbi:MAG: hypothetical protein JWL94_1288 [Microbacteriaceae bacterium]|jgi:uncharacterized spore protein YtfJ|nr:hypothetical protein [Microbacteriaceae bacterium]HEV7955541.1 hypothetical protein [Marisediminicola sp.]